MVVGVSSNIHSIAPRADACSASVTGNGTASFGLGFEECELPLSVESAGYPDVLRSFASSGATAARRSLSKAEDAARVERGLKSAISKLWPKNAEIHVKRESNVVYVYKMMMGGGL